LLSISVHFSLAKLSTSTSPSSYSTYTDEYRFIFSTLD
jgi:hypothetical protein